MFRNYIDTALRALLTHKLFSFINLSGLAIGLASVILIGLYVRDELSYDGYHADVERLYRVSRDYYPVNMPEELLLATNAAPAAPLLKADFPEVEESARLYGGRVLLSWDDIAFYDDAKFVDPAFFRMFSFDWLAGDAASALERPLTIVLSESAARKYFGAADPLGRTMELENAMPLTVTGVIRDLPGNTHLTGNAFVALESLLSVFGEGERTNWNSASYYTYIKLAPGASIDTVQQGLPAFVDRHVGENASQWTGLSAMPVNDIHLHSTRQFEMKPPGSMANVVTLITVAFGILLIACFNFMNLSTALSALRGREVGVRKSIGAARGQLVRQFLLEAFGMVALGIIVAVAIVELLLPAFNGFTGKALTFDLLHDGVLQAGLLLLLVIVGCGAGLYPAFHLAASNPVKVLRSGTHGTAGGVLFRNLLVILQFSISIVLVIATAVVLLQTRYARSLDTGFTPEQVVMLNGTPTQGLTAQWEALKDRLLDHPDVVAVTASNLAPGMENLNSFEVRRPGASEMKVVPFLFVDYDFFETYEVPVLSGRTFDEDFPADRITLSAPNAAPAAADTSLGGNYILNVSAARAFGWTPDEAVDQQLDLQRMGVRMNGRVVGVVADSNFESARFSTKPLLFILSPQGRWGNEFPTLASAAVRIRGSNPAATLEFIDRTWTEVVPDFPVTRSFLSERIDALYQDDSRLGQLYSWFAALAILIACLGLFGLATFNAQRRIKEIGVRKVMGGSVWSIVLLLTNDFSKLVLISNLIAWPAAYFAMQRWLENFAYRIDLTPLVFIGSGLIALCIAWVTVGGTAAKAASAKPVLALRYE